MKALVVYDSVFGNTEQVAREIGKALEAGGRLVAPPEGFAVEGTEGPLKQGELERAAEWARRCGAVQ
jgi:hypothetical protein